MSDQTDDFVHMWEWFSTHCHGYSPLYERISLAVAGDRDLLDAVRGAPPDAHLPPALLAAVHYLLLEGEDHPLADVYAARSDADPGPLFLDLCRTRREEVMALLATRRIQTNDCGRSALIAPGLTWAASRHPGPLALVDVGASAGLNLLLDQYRIDYGAHGVTGPPQSPVEIACRVRGGVTRRLPVACPAWPPGSASTVRRSTSPMPATPGGCWRACGPTPIGSSGRRHRFAWRRATRPVWWWERPTTSCRRCWPISPTAPPPPS